MARRRRVAVERDRSNDYTYLSCEHTDPDKDKNTKRFRKIGVAWCELRCNHKCLEFSTIPEYEIVRNIRLLIEKSGTKYFDDVKSFDLNKEIYKRCILCANECKKQGIGILISCEDFVSSGRKKISKALKKEAEKILDNSSNLSDLVIDIPEETPKKKRGRPKGSTKKPKPMKEKKDVKKQKSRSKTTGKKTTKKETKRTKSKKVSRKTTGQKSKIKRRQKATNGLVKGKVKSIRKARGKKLFRLTLKNGQKFEPTGPRSPVNKYLEAMRELWGSDISLCRAVVTMAGKKVKGIEIQQ